MRIVPIVFLCVLGQDNSSQTVLQRVAEALGSQREDLKYYLCVENVRFRSWDSHGGQVFNRQASYEFRVLEDEEVREPLRKKKNQTDLPLMSFGGFFASIYGVLGPENLRHYDFKVTPGKAAETVIEVEVPRDKSVSRVRTLDGRDVVFGFKAKIVVHTPTGRLKSFQRTATRLGGRIKHLEHRIDFALRDIDGKPRNMPIQQESLLQHGVRWFSLKHEYTDFKRFVSAVKIKFK